jgi:hypothetical protein
MKRSAIAILVSASLFLLASSCEIFEDQPDEYMARQVTWRTYEFIDELFSKKSIDIYNAGGVGASVEDATHPPNMAPKTISMTVTDYQWVDGGHYRYAGDVKMNNWSSDGSSPYMNLTGSVHYMNDIITHTGSLTGTLKVENGPEGNTIDSITFFLTFRDYNWTSGTVKADWTTISFNDAFVPTE